MERFTQNAEKALLQAQELAQQFHKNQVRPEHLLLGLLSTKGCTANNILSAFQINTKDLYQEVKKNLQTNKNVSRHEKISFASSSKSVLEAALQEAQAMFRYRVGTEHILLALLQNQHSVLTNVLKAKGLALNRLRDAIRQQSKEEAPTYIDVASLRKLTSHELDRQKRFTKSLERMDQLLKLAKSAYLKGLLDTGEVHAQDLLDEFTRNPSHSSAGNAFHLGHLILGRLALRDGKLAKAREHLLTAGKTTGSPTLGSFGPNMLLAKEFLERNEREVVLEYFELCRRFWKSGSTRLDDWTRTVKQGGIPAFGANLRY